MAFYYSEPSHTFSEYLLVPGYTSEECIPANVSLKTPLVKYRKGQEPDISLNIPMISAIMQSVSNDTLAIALAKEGKDAYVGFKCNSVTSKPMIEKLIEASQAGVHIDMVVRGICCIVPGVRTIRIIFA